MTRRILVVEDQEDNRRIIRDLLTSVGYELIEAIDGDDGRAPRAGGAARSDPDGHPAAGVDGYEATRRIKAEPGLAAIPIIVGHLLRAQRRRREGDGRRLRRLRRQAVQPAPALLATIAI